MKEYSRKINNVLKANYINIISFITILILAYYPYPSLYGVWESEVILNIFFPESLYFHTLIHPRANIGGFEYFPLDISRILFDTIGINLSTIRFFPILYGILSLIIVYRILEF